MTEVNRPGVIYYIDGNTQDKLETCDLLKGKIIKGLSKSHSDELLAFDDENIYNIATGKVIDQNSYAIVSSNGKNVTSAITQQGELYTWGEGLKGELGLGIAQKHVTQPTLVTINSRRLVRVSTGPTHTAACDNFGNVYTFGQNNHRQLGLYNKTKLQLENKGGIIQALSYIPRLVPLSIKHPMKSVACGSSFTIFLTKRKFILRRLYYTIIYTYVLLLLYMCM